MDQIKTAARELVLEMERQGRSKAVYYSLADEKGFHPVISFSETKELLEVEGDIRMVIEEIDIEILKVLGNM